MLVFSLVLMMAAAVLGWGENPRWRAKSERLLPAHTLTQVRLWVIGRWQRRARQLQAARMVAAFAAELRAGMPMALALQRADASFGLCPVTIAGLATGADIETCLRKDAKNGPLPLLEQLATLWQVSAHNGAGMAVACDRLATAGYQHYEFHRELKSLLAGPKTTARVVALLPLLGLGFAALLGARPLTILLGTWWGILLLVAGIALDVAGVLWLQFMIRQVERKL